MLTETTLSFLQWTALIGALAMRTKDASAPIEGLPPQVNPSSVRSTAFELAEGKTSSYMPGSDGGYILFVEKFLPVSEEEVKAELPEFVQQMRRQNAAEAFNDWFAHEIQLARLQLPGDQTEGAQAQ